VENKGVSARNITEVEKKATDSKRQIDKSSVSQSLNQIASDKIHALLRANEELGAQLFEAKRLLSVAQLNGAQPSRLLTLPLEVKLAQRVMERMPLVIRKIIRKLTVLCIALWRS
jgi:hypothetical protein